MRRVASLQKAGMSSCHSRRICVVTQTLPFASIIGLWGFAGLWYLPT